MMQGFPRHPTCSLMGSTYSSLEWEFLESVSGSTARHLQVALKYFAKPPLGGCMLYAKGASKDSRAVLAFTESKEGKFLEQICQLLD